MRKCCPILIKLLTLQHPHCGHHYLQACSSCFVTLAIATTPFLFLAFIGPGSAKNNSDWSFLVWICKNSDLKSRRSSRPCELIVHRQRCQTIINGAAALQRNRGNFCISFLSLCKLLYPALSLDGKSPASLQ